MNIMSIDTIDDWELRIKRQDAFWEKEIIDRPVVCMTVSDSECNIPESHHESLSDRWMDSTYQVELATALVKSKRYYGDALPVVYPNLGPDFYAACYGGNLIFEEETSYIEPLLDDWNYLLNLKLSKENKYFLKMEELYRIFLEAGKGLFYTGMPDLHPGADCLSGFRGPMNLNYDMLDHPQEIEQALKKVNADFLQFFDHYYHKLINLSQPVTGWPGIVSDTKWHVPSNDFSCMVSHKMFIDFFIEPLIEEMKHMEKNVYHLDGPGALQHLNSLLNIPELSAVQWVYGAGNGTTSDYIGIYQSIQNAGKSIQMMEVFPGDLDALIDNLAPEGVWMNVWVDNDDEADYVMKKINNWR